MPSGTPNPDPFDADRRAEDELRAILAARGERLDDELLHRALAGAIAYHPDRAAIQARLDAGAILFVKPAADPRRAALPPSDPNYAREDDLVVSVGWPRDRKLCPPGVRPGECVEMGTIPLAVVLARPSATEAGSN